MSIEWDSVGVFSWLPLGPWISTNVCLSGIIYLFQTCTRKFLSPLIPIEHLLVQVKKDVCSNRVPLSCLLKLQCNHVLQNSSPDRFMLLLYTGAGWIDFNYVYNDTVRVLILSDEIFVINVLNLTRFKVNLLSF